ncbi:tetratricopeptide repeat protein [Albidovulum sp.]
MAPLHAVLAVAIASLAACQQTGGVGRDWPSPYAPAGVPAGQQSVDGLIVGHRLMAAGEYELALKAYLRAAADHGATVDTLSAIGSANLKLGRLGQAERMLRRAIEMDETFVPAWNNLGVVLMEQGKIGEASRVFRTAYALDSGQSDSIRDNLRLALAKFENQSYDSLNENNATGEFKLVRRGHGQYLLLTTQ